MKLVALQAISNETYNTENNALQNVLHRWQYIMKLVALHTMSLDN